MTHITCSACLQVKHLLSNNCCHCSSIPCSLTIINLPYCASHLQFIPHFFFNRALCSFSCLLNIFNSSWKESFFLIAYLIPQGSYTHLCSLQLILHFYLLHTHQIYFNFWSEFVSGRDLLMQHISSVSRTLYVACLLNFTIPHTCNEQLQAAKASKCIKAG